MRNRIFIIVSLLFLCVSFLEAQEMEDFTIDDQSTIYFVKPKFMKAPDFTKSSQFIIDPKYIASLAGRILSKFEKVIDNEINSSNSMIRICFDKTGKIIYAYFILDPADKPGEKLSEKDLRKIMDAFTSVKLDMSKIETDFGQDKEFQLGILFFKLKKKKK